MAPTQLTPLAPAELSYIHTSLSQTPPIRPDGRLPTQFRPLVAETDILPSTNGSARICFADGTEAIVGVKCEVEKTGGFTSGWTGEAVGSGDGGASMEGVEAEAREEAKKGRGEGGWVEVGIDIPGYRDDDALPVFLGAMLTEALLADGRVKDRLFINERFHWRMFVDVSVFLFFSLHLQQLAHHYYLQFRSSIPSTA